MHIRDSRWLHPFRISQCENYGSSILHLHIVYSWESWIYLSVCTWNCLITLNARGFDCGLKQIAIHFYVHICGYVCSACPIKRCLYCFFLTNANAFVWNCIIASLSSLKHEFNDAQFTASYFQCEDICIIAPHLLEI